MSPGSLGLRTASYGSLQQQLQNGLLPSQLPPPVLPFVARKPAKMLKEKERLFHWIFKFVGRKKMGMMFLCIVSAAVFMWVLYVGKGEASIRIHNVTAMNYESSPSYFERSSISKYFAGYTLLPGNPCEKFTLPPPPADKKRTGPRPCPVCYLSVEAAIALMPSAPSYSPVHSLTYVHEEYLSKTEFGGSKFGGYPSLKQREDSYHIQKLMTVHCGFVKGSKPGLGTGFDIDDTDLLDMEQCRGIVVASAIFGYYDLIHQPTNISEVSKKDVCFFMFLDEETEAAMRNTLVLDGNKKVGLWRIVIVHNLPYTDPRRNGKVPKLLLHRLFPNTHYSIWMDGKLELVVDPYQILERFLWRQNATFAISRHYRRFNVFVEAEANKAAAKYDNSSIDFQIEFYKKEGLTPYSIAKLPIASDVPEGCVIIREHVPISNLFGCLWFNEVDRFTSRDQISFSTVRDKIRKRTNWTVSMFLDCERRNFVVQAYHRDVISQKLAALSAIPSLLLPPPPPQTPAILAEKPPSRRVPSGRGKGRRRNRKVSAGVTDNEPGLNFGEPKVAL